MATHPKTRTILTALISLIGALAMSATAQGIETKRGAMILYGAAGKCTQPGQIDFKKVRNETPEWKTIRSEGVATDSARYSLLVSDMNKRIKEACRKVARDEGIDCVVRKGEVADDRGLEVKDLTSEVIKKLESDEQGS